MPADDGLFEGDVVDEIANGTGSCLTFTARSTVSEQNLADTIPIQKMPVKHSNVDVDATFELHSYVAGSYVAKNLSSKREENRTDYYRSIELR